MIDDEVEHVESMHTAPESPQTTAHPLATPAAQGGVEVPAAAASPAVNRGGLASLVRPGFLRFSRNGAQGGQGGQGAPDLERGQAVAAA